MFFVIASVFACSCAVVDPSQAFDAKTITVAGKSVKVAIAPGQCWLDMSSPSDVAGLAGALPKMPPTNTLHTVLLDCKDVNEWRKSINGVVLNAWELVATVKQLESQNYSGREAVARNALCDEGRRFEAAQPSLKTSNMAERITAAAKQASVVGGAYLGVLGEDDYGCYFGLIARTGDPKAPLALGVYASTYLGGRTVDLYAYSKDVTVGSLQRLVDERKAVAKASVEANSK